MFNSITGPFSAALDKVTGRLETVPYQLYASLVGLMVCVILGLCGQAILNNDIMLLGCAVALTLVFALSYVNTNDNEQTSELVMAALEILITSIGFMVTILVIGAAPKTFVFVIAAVTATAYFLAMVRHHGFEVLRLGKENKSPLAFMYSMVAVLVYLCLLGMIYTTTF